MMESYRNNFPSASKIFIYLLVALGLLVISQLILDQGFAFGLSIAFLPLILYFTFTLTQKPIYAFLVLYILSYLIMGIGRYVSLPIPAGITVDLFVAFVFLVLLFRSLLQKVAWGRLNHPLSFFSLLWLIYCILEIFNPQSSIENWIISIRGIAGYFFLFVILTTLVFEKYKYLKMFLFIWSLLVLFGALKGIGQKVFGFDGAENSWVHTIGAHTHLISTGIRYFSFFSDAANYGCQMGLGAVVFSIIAIYESSFRMKIYYWTVAVFAIYGMMISGTRAAMAVPFVGLLCFICIIRQWKWIVFGGILFAAALTFFNFTTIGQGNAEIRRMRTAFRYEHDASYNLRLENQQRMRQFMNHYPLGLGVGSAKHTEEGDLLFGLPTDTSFVYIWVETGVVGLVLYLCILLTVLGFGIYYVMFKLKHPYVRGITTALTAGFAGMLVAGYANEVLHQFPAGQTLYICMTCIMLSPRFDKELMNAEHN